MNSDDRFWLGFHTILAVVILGTIWLTTNYTKGSYQDMYKNGYVECSILGSQHTRIQKPPCNN